MRYNKKNVRCILCSISERQLVVRQKIINLQKDLIFYLCFIFYRKIISKPNPLSGSKFYMINPDTL